MKAYVLDDERLAVGRLTRLLEETRRVEIAGSETDPERALAFLNAHPVDVLFLDIQMPGLTGFEVIERLTRDPCVVFTTAYDRYALNAFDVNSIDYLLKPVEPERLTQALDKVERLRDAARLKGSRSGEGSRSGDVSRSDVRALARQLAAELSPQRRLDRIASKVGERTTILDVARITHFFSKDKLTFAVADGREHVVDATLSELEGRLDPRRFVRIHRATVVNLAFVQELFLAVDGGVLARLKGEKQTELSVARDRVRELKDRLGI